MPIDTVFEPENNLIRLRYHGKIGPEDILQNTLWEHQQSDFRTGMHSLSDFSTAKFVGLSFDVVHQYSTHMPEIEKIRGSCRWAMVSSNLINYGILRMFSLLNGDSPIELKVFRDLAEGEEWLQEGQGNTSNEHRAS
jgi:hypothetical protein